MQNLGVIEKMKVFFIFCSLPFLICFVSSRLECGLRFVIFSQEELQNDRRRRLKILCTFRLGVHACVHVRAHQQFWKGKNTNLDLS